MVHPIAIAAQGKDAINGCHGPRYYFRTWYAGPLMRGKRSSRARRQQGKLAHMGESSRRPVVISAPDTESGRAFLWPHWLRLSVAAVVLAFVMAGPAPVKNIPASHQQPAVSSLVTMPATAPKVQRSSAEQTLATGPRSCSSGRGVWWRCGRQ